MGALDDGKWRKAADLLYDHWQAGTVLDDIPEAIRPTTRAEGYAVQAQIEGRSSRPLFGWKIAATSAAGQAHINVDGPLAGRLLAERVVPENVPVRLGANRMRVAEVEFAFLIGRDLPPRVKPYTQDEVMDAVRTLHLAVEVPDSRFADFQRAGAPQLIADDACADQFVLGVEAPADWRRHDLAGLRVIGTVTGRPPHVGSGANVLGDPRSALTWLANELSRHDMILRAGEVVTTGTCVVPLPIGPGNAVVGDYGPLGRIEVNVLA